MHPLDGLPKNAEIDPESINYLGFENYKMMFDLCVEHCVVVNHDGLLHWITNVIRSGGWNPILQLLKRNGFRFGPVMDECIADLKNNTKSAWVLYWFGGDGNTTSDRMKFLTTRKGKTILTIFEKKLKTCKNWNDLYNALNIQGDFFKEINNRVRTGLKQCIVE